MRILRHISVFFQASPEKVFEQQRKLMEEKLVYGELPLLQAVVVCVKRFPYDEVDVTRIPQPTILREGPGSFGLEITEFYLNPTLSHSLDLKLQRFLNIPNNLQFLYERVMRKIDLMEEQMIKAELRKIDSEHSSRSGLKTISRQQRLNKGHRSPGGPMVSCQPGFRSCRPTW